MLRVCFTRGDGVVKKQRGFERQIPFQCGPTLTCNYLPHDESVLDMDQNGAGADENANVGEIALSRTACWTPTKLKRTAASTR